jgi:hypothetical protein
VYSLSELDGFRATNGTVTNIGNIPSTAIVSESEAVIGDFNEFDDAFSILRTGGEGQPDGVAASPGVRASVIGKHIGVFDDRLLKALPCFLPTSSRGMPRPLELEKWGLQRRWG